MIAQPKKVCHHGIAPVNHCSYCELNLCGRPLRSGRGCKRSVFHKETCFAPWPTTVFEHPWDCHCWKCDEKTPPEDGDVSPEVDLIVDLAKLLERRFKPHKAMTLASSILAHPEDAAQPVAWRFRFSDKERWNYKEIKPYEDFTPPLTNPEVQPLYAHPEDAPEGPFHAKPSDVQGDSRWMVTYQDEKTGCIYVTEGECKDIRDVLNRHALNREVRDKGDKADGNVG